MCEPCKTREPFESKAAIPQMHTEATPLVKLVRYEISPDAHPIQHGQGLVWRARDLLFDEDVALKELSIDLRSDRKALAAFRKEAAAGARLSRISPYVVRVSDFGEIDGILFFAMEWMDGGHLGYQCGKVSLTRAVHIVRQISRALETAHTSGIVHSDIAPENILADANRNAYKLADFGYLKVLDSTLLSRGETSLLAGGRLYYLPPSHLYDPSKINKSTDIYALALTLHRLVSGEQLARAPDGQLEMPGVIRVRHDGRPAPDQLRQLLSRFVEGRC
jgi:serine/threonine protein kinase